MSLRACDLCGNTKRAHRSILAHGCTDCGATICARHARVVDGVTICARCLRKQPAEVQRAALRAVV